jgi:hypothetical protein
MEDSYDVVLEPEVIKKIENKLNVSTNYEGKKIYIYFEFMYPVASDITIKFFVGNSENVIILKGETSVNFTTNVPPNSSVYIISITPSEDDIYIYKY